MLKNRLWAAVAAVAVLGSSVAGATAAAGTAGLPESSVADQLLVNKAAVSSKVSLGVSHKVLRKGEQVWVAGRVKHGEDYSVGRQVILEHQAKGSGSWVRVALLTTDVNGKFRIQLRPTVAGTYRARVTNTGGTKAVSAAVATRFSAANRTLGSRISVTGSRLGTAQGKVESLSAAKRRATKVKGVSSVQYQDFSKATVVKVKTSKKMRTWLVMGKIRKEYLAAKGAAGKYGVPLQDAKCNLLEGGCVQRFSRGVIYSNDNRKAAGASVKSRRGEVIAAARSQLGIRYPYVMGPHYTKYNAFMGSSSAWCSLFQSWASVASGNGSLFPQAKNFDTFLSQVRGTMRIGTTPKVGALAFMDTRPPWGTVNHVGLVVAVKGSKVTVIDGNMGAGAGYRGVNERVATVSSLKFYAYPEY